MQSFVLVLLGLIGRPLPPTGSFLKNFPLVEILLGIAVLAFASMCLGLLVSALVSTSEKAMPFLVLLTMIQVILSGGVVSLVGKAGLSELAWISPSRWGYGAVASTANLNVISPSAGGNFTDPLWAHTAGTWLKDMGGQAGLAVIFALLAWWRPAPPRPAPPQGLNRGRTGGLTAPARAAPGHRAGRAAARPASRR